MKQKEETDAFSAALFCCRKLRDSRSDSRSYRSGSGRSLRDGEPQLPVHGAVEGCRPHSLLGAFIAAAGAATAPRHDGKGPGTLLPRELLEQRCDPGRVSPSSSTSLPLSYEEPHHTRSTGTTITGYQRHVAEYEWVVNGVPAAHLLGEKNSCQKNYLKLVFFNVFNEL